jgi:hypothetical protein
MHSSEALVWPKSEYTEREYALIGAHPHSHAVLILKYDQYFAGTTC